ncbi:MAG: DNA alkylation repair protein [Halanaerobiales bacterium]|nr:DNA alkylation repair protein [Halanaerobiales bacterium]
MKIIKERKKSLGVPKSDPKDGYLEGVKKHLLDFGFQKNIVEERIKSMIEEGFYELTLTEQAKNVTENVLSLGVDSSTQLELTEYFAKSNNHRIRCRVPDMFVFTLGGEPIKCLERLIEIADDPATGPRENAQGAMRQLLLQNGPSFISELERLKYDSRENVRRACVEATRPRGVWVPFIPFLREDPEKIFSIIDYLIDDPSKYVNKAVANSINDISKDNQEIAINWCSMWKEKDLSTVEWVIKHGLRWLRKKDFGKVQHVFGYEIAECIDMKVEAVNGFDIQLNEVIVFKITLENKALKDFSAYLQYRLTMPGKGNKPRVRIYEGGEVHIGSLESIVFERKHHLTDTSNCKLENGAYIIDWIVNGKVKCVSHLNFHRS